MSPCVAVTISFVVGIWLGGCLVLLGAIFGRKKDAA